MELKAGWCLCANESITSKRVSMDEPPASQVAEPEPVDNEPRSVWRFERANRASVIIDVDAYFELIREAMPKARQSLFLIGWDFDTRIHLSAHKRQIPSDSG